MRRKPIFSLAHMFQMKTLNKDAKQSKTDLASIKRENTELLENITQMKQEVASFDQMNRLLQSDNE